MKILKKKWVFSGIAVLVIVGAIVFGLTRPLSVAVAEVSPKEVRLFFTEEGFVKDESTIDVYSLHSGAILSLFVKENQHVEAGEPLCLIDTSRLERELENAKSTQKGLLSQIEDLDLKEKQKKDEMEITRSKLYGEYQTITFEESNAGKLYLSAEITKEEQINLQSVIIEQNKTDLRNADENLQKIEALYAAGAVSKQEVDDQRVIVSQFESVLAQNNRQLEIIRNSNEALSREEYFQKAKESINEQISAIDAQLGNTYTQAMKDYYQTQIDSSDASILLLEKQIEECAVKAPAAGVITKLNMDKSNIAGTDMPLATITIGFEPLIEVYVPTSEIGSVNLGDLVELELKSEADNTYDGIVAEIDDKAVIQTSSLGVEKRKVKVTIKPIPEHISHFKPGYDLSVRFTTFYGENHLTVPRTSVTRIDDKPFVWVVAGGKAEQREIEIERELKVEYVIKSGISAGDQVVKDATATGLENGKSVTGELS